MSKLSQIIIIIIPHNSGIMYEKSPYNAPEKEKDYAKRRNHSGGCDFHCFSHSFSLDFRLNFNIILILKYYDIIVNTVNYSLINYLFFVRGVYNSEKLYYNYSILLWNIMQILM